MHYYEINDSKGDLVELVPFCSDSCHVEWCARMNLAYDGWNGAHESEYNEYCAACGVIANAGDESCEHQQDNFVVNRFLSEDGETCEHGNWIQLPYKRLEQRMWSDEQTGE